ncbi:TPA: hypothetical protein N0F65_001611, partial [Lagenidium giganteum]
FIHHNYASHHDALYDPSDLTTVKPRQKGKRSYFIAAIIDANNDGAQLIRASLDIFGGGGRQTQTYHGMFTGAYACEWMKRLLAILEANGWHNCVILLGNAKYHKVKPTWVPSRGNKKEVLVAVCNRLGIHVESKDTKAKLWAKLMAEDAGHRVVFTPPHHSDLEPIELVWTNVKGTVGRQYASAMTLADVKERLVTAFANLKGTTVQKCMNKSDASVRQLEEKMEAMKQANKADDRDSE